MGSLGKLLLATAVTLAGQAWGATAGGGDTIAIQEMTLTVPDGWRLRQDAKDNGTILLGFENGAQYLSLYVKQATDLDMKTIFANGATIVRDVRTVPHNSHNWQVLETSKRFAAHNKTYYVSSYMTVVNGYTYYGYSRGDSSAQAMAAVDAFLEQLR